MTKESQQNDYASVKTAIILPLLLACAVSSAQTVPPPSRPVEALTWSPSMKRQPSTGAKLGRLRIDFEKTTLAEILLNTEVGAIQHSGDAGESVYWLCYTLNGPTPARLWITADGEMGGPARAVTGITIAALKSGQPVAGCPALPLDMQPASLQGDIRLGMYERSIVKMLGVPSHRGADWISYDFEGKAKGNCPSGFDVLNSLVLKTRRGTVDTIYANQVTSC